MNIFDDMRSRVSPQFQSILEPLFEIDESRLAAQCCTFGLQQGFFMASFYSEGGRSCPFEIHIGTGDYIGLMSFFIGLGAEFYNCDSVRTTEEAADARGDVEGFVKSAVTCELYERRSTIVKASYTADSLVAWDGQPLTLWYWGRWRPFAHRRTLRYEPWVP